LTERFERVCNGCCGPITWEERGVYAESPRCERCGPVEHWQVVDKTGAVLASASLERGPEGAERLLLGLARWLDPPRQRAA
jgi:hypothetical protein